MSTKDEFEALLRPMVEAMNNAAAAQNAATVTNFAQQGLIVTYTGFALREVLTTERDASKDTGRKRLLTAILAGVEDAQTYRLTLDQLRTLVGNDPPAFPTYYEPPSASEEPTPTLPPPADEPKKGARPPGSPRHPR